MLNYLNTIINSHELKALAIDNLTLSGYAGVRLRKFFKLLYKILLKFNACRYSHSIPVLPVIRGYIIRQELPQGRFHVKNYIC